MFMLICVPEPVCQTTSGNSASCLPAITSSAAAMIACRLVLRQHAEIDVDLRGGALDLGQRAHQLTGHALAGDLEVLQRALRLRAPQPVGGDFDVAEGVSFDAHVGHGRFICMINCMSTDLLNLANNLPFVDEVYAKYVKDPASVDPAGARSSKCERRRRRRSAGARRGHASTKAPQRQRQRLMHARPRSPSGRAAEAPAVHRAGVDRRPGAVGGALRPHLRPGQRAPRARPHDGQARSARAAASGAAAGARPARLRLLRRRSRRGHAVGRLLRHRRRCRCASSCAGCARPTASTSASR